MTVPDIYPPYIKSVHISSIESQSTEATATGLLTIVANHDDMWQSSCNGNGVESSKFYYSLSIVMIFDIHSIRSQSMTRYCALNCVCIHRIRAPSIPCNSNYDRPLYFCEVLVGEKLAKTSACRQDLTMPIILWAPWRRNCCDGWSIKRPPMMDTWLKTVGG